VPESIIQRHIIQKGAHSVTQGLIKWSNLPVCLAMWEDLEFLRQQFPHATVWSCPGEQEGGNVMALTTVQGPTTGVAEASSEAGLLPRRSTRPTTQNVRVFGPDWKTT